MMVRQTTEFAKYNRIVLTARAVGVLFIGLGLRIIGPFVRNIVSMLEREGQPGAAFGRFSTLLEELSSREFLWNLAYSTAGWGLAIAFGIFLIRVDPRKFLPHLEPKHE